MFCPLSVCHISVSIYIYTFVSLFRSCQYILTFVSNSYLTTDYHHNFNYASYAEMPLISVLFMGFSLYFDLVFTTVSYTQFRYQSLNCPWMNHKIQNGFIAPMSVHSASYFFERLTITFINIVPYRNATLHPIYSLQWFSEKSLEQHSTDRRKWVVLFGVYSKC